MHVAICIVSFRNPGDLDACLAALALSTYSDFEVVICENGGEAAQAALRLNLAAQLPSGQGVSILGAPSNRGYAGGVNLCMNHAASGDAWWILNPDTIPDPEALSRLVLGFSAGEHAALGCTLRAATGEVESRGGRWNRWLARAVSIDHGAPPSAEAESAQSRIDYVSGAAMFVGRSFVDQVGLMREDYFLYGEEVEWCLRAKASGLSLGIVADAEVLHRQGTTTGSVNEITQRSRLSVYLDERNKLLITRDRFLEILPVAAIGALAMLSLRFARRGAWAQFGYALQGWWDGLRNRRGRPAWVAAN